MRDLSQETLLVLKYGSMEKAYRARFGCNWTDDDRWEIRCIDEWLANEIRDHNKRIRRNK